MACKTITPILIILGTLGQGIQVLGQQSVWPKPPDKARIVLERVLSDPNDFKQEENLWGKFKKWFSQESARQFVRPVGIDVKGTYLAVADPGAGGVFLFNRNEHTYLFINKETERNFVFTPIDVTLGKDLLYVTDPSSAGILVFDYKGTYIKTIEPEILSRRPTGIALRDNRIYYVDTPLHRIISMDLKSGSAVSYGGRGKGIGEFNYPTFVAVSTSGRVYITDTMNFRIQRLSPGGEWLAPIGDRGMMSGQLNRPKGIAVDRRGRLYVVDNSFDNVQVFSESGSFLLPFGSSGHHPGEFLMPTDIAIEGDLIYVTDSMNHRIQIFRMLYD